MALKSMVLGLNAFLTALKQPGDLKREIRRDWSVGKLKWQISIFLVYFS